MTTTPGQPDQYRSMNTLAVATLVISLLLPPIAIPFGHIALKQVRRTGESGDELAKAGLVIGYLYLGIFVIACLAVLVVATWDAHF